MGEQGTFGPVLHHKAQSLPGLIQLGTDFFGTLQGFAVLFRFQHDTAIFLQGQVQGIAIRLQRVQRQLLHGN